MADHAAGVLERPDDERVGVEHVHAGPRLDLGRVAALRVHRHDRVDAVGVADVLVLLAVTGGQVDDAGAVLGRHEVRGQHPEGVGLVGEEREQRRVAPADELGALHGADPRGAGELPLVVAEPGLRQEVALPVLLHHRVVDVRTDGERQVRRQRPRRGRPGEDALGGPSSVGSSSNQTVSAGSWRSR